MFVIGGDKIVPVLSLENHKISDKKGPIATELQDWYESTLEQGTNIYEWVYIQVYPISQGPELVKTYQSRTHPEWSNQDFLLPSEFSNSEYAVEESSQPSKQCLLFLVFLDLDVLRKFIGMLP